jgi:periplasmic divalent cation tolerance protein
VGAENDLVVVLCTVPDEATAERLANGLVKERLAACVNAILGVKSFYRWRGKIVVDSELQLVIKTRRGRFDDLAAWVKANHPYEVPEIVAIPAERVSNEYLVWAVKQTSAE